jgi:hypothetical protein
MEFDSLKSLIRQLLAAGFVHVAYLDIADMVKVEAIVKSDPRAIKTPDQELRYIEGLFELPFGYITDFRVIPMPGSERCQCGRVPTALDVVSYAHRKAIHPKSLIRDTLIGLRPTVELGANGRVCDCIKCGRPITMESYWMAQHKYLYSMV